MDEKALDEIIKKIKEIEEYKRLNKIETFYPDQGPLRRELYKKHLEFFDAGKIHRERAAIAGNRCGKTTLGCYEASLHLLGRYPDWWTGKKFSSNVDWWAASDTSETTRDILQKEFMGPMNDIGTGMIPKSNILGYTRRRGVPDAIDTVEIKSELGGISVLGFKSYDQGREKFQGTAKDGINLDEEPPEDVYDECMTRLMTKMGLMICTFTPLKGMSSIVLRYLENYKQEPEK